MCQYQTLYHDDATGYVVRCSSCAKMQIGYGNLVLTVDEEEMEAFRWWLQRIAQEQPAGQDPALRCILIPTPAEGVKLLLSSRELASFVQMLQAADAELQALALIKLFEAQ